MSEQTDMETVIRCAVELGMPVAGGQTTPYRLTYVPEADLARVFAQAVADHQAAAKLEVAVKALHQLVKSSDSVHREIMEFGKPVSTEKFEWWQDAMNKADAALKSESPAEET